MIEKPKRAYFLAWAIETALGFLIFVVMFGNVAMPMYNSVSTAGWDPYAILLWGFLAMVALAAFLIRVINAAKAGYQPLIGGSY
jgi:hypothetical protein